MKVITIANKKGGIGKTASTVTLATLLGKYGKKTLVLDLNPGQANTSSYFQRHREIRTVVDIFIHPNMPESSVRKLICETDYANVDIMPANETLYADESKIPIKADNMFSLNNALAYLVYDYDFVLIDCGPNMNELVLSALCASDWVLIPVQDEIQSRDGFLNLYYIINEVCEKLNPKLGLLGAFFTMTNPNTSTYKEYYKYYKKILKDRLFDTYIRSENILKQAVSSHTPLPYYTNSSKALLDYHRLLRELKFLKGEAATKLNDYIGKEEQKEQARKEKEQERKKSRWFLHSRREDEIDG